MQASEHSFSSPPGASCFLETRRFTANLDRLAPPKQHYRFCQAVTVFVVDRATWQYGQEIVPGVPHIIWRRIGTHSVLVGP